MSFFVVLSIDESSNHFFKWSTVWSTMTSQDDLYPYLLLCMLQTFKNTKSFPESGGLCALPLTAEQFIPPLSLEPLVGHRPSTTARHCPQSRAIRSSSPRSSRSAWRLPPGPFSRSSCVSLFFSSPEGSRSGPDEWCLSVVSSGCVQSIAIFFWWSLLLLALGWFSPRDLCCWW